jgi:hypothetical protein
MQSPSQGHNGVPGGRMLEPVPHAGCATWLHAQLHPHYREPSRGLADGECMGLAVPWA